MLGDRKQYQKVNRAWIWEKIGFKPHKAQFEILTSEARFRVAICGTRMGKSLLAAVAMVEAALAPCEASVGWVVSRTYDLTDRVWKEVSKILNTHFKDLIIRESRLDRTIELYNLGGGISEIAAKSADSKESLLGIGLSYVVIDEASRLDREIWESYLSQRLLDHKGWALFISTPNGLNYLHDLWQRGEDPEQPEWQSFRFPSRVNPFLDNDAIEAERKVLPISVFDQEYEAGWRSGSGAVMRHVLEAATLEWPDDRGIPPFKGNEYDTAERYTAGLDLARLHDFTCLVVMDSKQRVVFIDRFNKLDWDVQIPRIKAVLDRYNNAFCQVDATGMGSEPTERLKKLGSRVRAVVLTPQKKAEVIGSLQVAFEQKEIQIPTSRFAAVMIDELLAYQYNETRGGNISTSSPGGKHDDTVIALALCAHATRPGAKSRGFISQVGTTTVETMAPMQGLDTLHGKGRLRISSPGTGSHDLFGRNSIVR